MSVRFDPYEYIGVIIPGAAATFGGMILFPDFSQLFGKDGIQIGGLGLFVIVSFIVGHLVQAVGNLFESALWRLLGGRPSDWILRPDQRLIATDQRNRLKQLVRDRFGGDLETLSHADWWGLTREIYALCQRASRTDRLDAFNRTYGLLRGILAACLLLAAVTVIIQPEHWRYAVMLGAAAVLAGIRMVRFGKYYGRELIVEFLGLPPK